MRAVNAASNVRNADDPAAIAQAAELIRAGRLVAFPTETVYGLGANTLNPAAVARIFEAKGRPATNPLIVHVASVEAARALAKTWPDIADRLADRFWPGPLTLVVEKAACVPDIVTAGGPTIGLRVPDHPAALALLEAAGVPIAAPSANRSEEVSPTTAQHVFDSLGDRVDLILDGGPTNVGIESTVLDVTETPPRVLRLGMVKRSDLEACIGKVDAPPTAFDGAPRSPGQMARHYAPNVPLVLTDTPLTFLRPGDGLLCLRSCYEYIPSIRWIEMPADPAEYAARLYCALRELEAFGVRRIVVERPRHGLAERDDWAAIHDRLRRAGTPKEDAS